MDFVYWAYDAGTIFLWRINAGGIVARKKMENEEPLRRK